MRMHTYMCLCTHTSQHVTNISGPLSIPHSSLAESTFFSLELFQHVSTLISSHWPFSLLPLSMTCSKIVSCLQQCSACSLQYAQQVYLNILSNSLTALLFFSYTDSSQITTRFALVAPAGHYLALLFKTQKSAAHCDVALRSATWTPHALKNKALQNSFIILSSLVNIYLQDLVKKHTHATQIFLSEVLHTHFCHRTAFQSHFNAFCLFLLFKTFNPHAYFYLNISIRRRKLSRATLLCPHQEFSFREQRLVHQSPCLHVSIHNTNPAVKHWGLKKAQGKMTFDIEYAVFSILEDKIQVTYLKNSKCISIFLEIFINYSLPSKLYELVSITLLHLAQECNIASITPTVQWYTHLSLGQSIKDINLFYTGHQMAISSWQHFVYYWHTLHSRW